jgi:hypothetical protein
MWPDEFAEKKKLDVTQKRDSAAETQEGFLAEANTVGEAASFFANTIAAFAQLKVQRFPFSVHQSNPDPRLAQSPISERTRLVVLSKRTSIYLDPDCHFRWR